MVRMMSACGDAFKFQKRHAFDCLAETLTIAHSTLWPWQPIPGAGGTGDNHRKLTRLVLQQKRVSIFAACPERYFRKFSGNLTAQQTVCVWQPLVGNCMLSWTVHFGRLCCSQQPRCSTTSLQKGLLSWPRRLALTATSCK